MVREDEYVGLRQAIREAGDLCGQGPAGWRGGREDRVPTGPCRFWVGRGQ